MPLKPERKMEFIILPILEMLHTEVNFFFET